MALGGGVFLTQNKKLPGSYINFVSSDSAGTSLSNRKVAAAAQITMSVDKDGNLYVTYKKDAAISFELDDEARLYASYDGDSNISFELDDKGDLYILEEEQ